MRIGLLLLALWSPAAVADEVVHPLEPPDLSSPRATLNTFLALGDAHSDLLRNEYWHSPSREVVNRVIALDEDRQRTLDLSAIPPAARFELGRDAIVYLYAVLSRIELPPEAEIPDATASADASDSEAGGPPARWTIPHTEITLERVAEGPQAGQFLFNSSTVARAREFYEKARALPYRRDVALKNYADMRPYLTVTGWLISSRAIAELPDWLKRSVAGQAVWKWLALATVTIAAVAAVVLVHRVARRGLTGSSVQAYLRRLVTPVTLLLVPMVLNQANRQLTLTGWVSGGTRLVAEAITYFALAWIVWVASKAVAETVIASPRIREHSLDAHLLRLAARVVGIVFVVAIILHVSARLGAPLYGLVAGLGVGGLALALAVRPVLENVIGSLTLFADRPVKVGEFCQFGDDFGTVEAIGLRSTRLRKLDDTVVTVPNADFSQMELTNFTRRNQWLYETTLSLRYETSPEQLRYVVAKVREMLLGHPMVSPNWLHVRFNSFGAYSLDILVFAYVRTREWLDYRAVREDINLRIMDIVAEAGTGFAVPSQTTYFSRDAVLDADRGREAEARVQAWRAEGQLPFPEFDAARRAEIEDSLDYPPEGSPGHTPRAESDAEALAAPHAAKRGGHWLRFGTRRRS